MPGHTRSRHAALSNARTVPGQSMHKSSIISAGYINGSGRHPFILHDGDPVNHCILKGIEGAFGGKIWAE